MGVSLKERDEWGFQLCLDKEVSCMAQGGAVLNLCCVSRMLALAAVLTGARQPWCPLHSAPEQPPWSVLPPSSPLANCSQLQETHTRWGPLMFP